MTTAESLAETRDAPRSKRLRYVASRVLTAAFVLVGATALLFVLTLMIPGNPAQVLLGPRATPEAVEAYAHAMGLDRPVAERLMLFFGHVLQGDLGTDIVSGRPVLDLIVEVLPYTVALTVSAMGLATVVGGALGVYSAMRPGGRGDQITAVLSVAFIATPNFVVAIFLLLIFSIQLDWLPVLGTGREEDFGEQILRLILPALSLALGWIGYVARLLRASLIEILGEAHIRTARAYGMSERRIVWKYALRLAAIPLLAVLGLGLGRLMGGAVFAEIVFARPGIGTLVYDALSSRNYPVVQGCVLTVATLFTLINLGVDLLYTWLDPRIARGDTA